MRIAGSTAAGLSCLALVACGGGDDGRRVTVPLDGRDQARIEVVDGADRLRVMATDLGGDLLEASAAGAHGAAPHADARDGGAVRLGLPEGGGTVDATVRLAERVRWEVALLAGVDDAVLDLSGAGLGGVEFRGGIDTLDLTLPRPRGEVPVRLLSGAGTVSVHAPPEVPVRVVFADGAGSAVIDGQVRSGIAAGTEITPAEWAGSADRYAVTLTGVGSFTLDRGEPR